jgi:Glycosyltransferase family 87/Glycosyl transferase family 2
VETTVAARAAVAPRLSRTWLAVILVATIVAANFVWRWIAFAGGNLKGADFFSFYAATRLFIETGGRHLYDAALQHHNQGQVTSQWTYNASLLPYIHPPFYTVVIAPLGWLGFHPAYLALAAVNVLLLAATVFAMSRASRWSRGETIVAGVITAAFLPVWVVIFQGQSDFFILLALSLSYYFWTRDREGWAGVFAGLAIVKPQMVLVIPLLLLARRAWRALGGFIAAAGGLFVVSLAFFDVHVWADYLGLIAPWAGGGSLSLPITGQSAYSLRGLLEGASGARVVALVVLALALLLVFVTLRWRAPRSGLDMAFAVAASVVLSPYLNIHDLALLAVPLLAVAGLARSGELIHPRLGWGVVAASVVAINLSSAVGTWLAALGAITLALYLAVERLSVGPQPLALGEIHWSGPRPKRVVVLPSYFAEKTVREVIAQIPRAEVDRILLVDDASSDRTAEIALELGIDVIKHPRNLGYGGNQKTCYANALLMGAEVVVMLHPDGQYDPALVPALCQAIEEGRGDVALGSRWLDLDPAAAGMPGWKRVGNRFLTATENQVLGLGLSEYHTGYRAYSRRFLETVPYAENSNDFVVDTQILVQAAAFGFKIAEVPAVGRYFEDMSSIGLKTSTVYGLKTLAALVAYIGHRAGIPCRWLVSRTPSERAAYDRGAQ